MNHVDRASAADEGMTLLDLAVMLVRSRRWIVAATVIGAVGAALVSISSTRQFQSIASFVPEEGQGAATGFAATARQLGLALPGGAKGWSAGLYVEILKSRNMLSSIAAETVVVAELGDRRIALLDLFEVTGRTAEHRLARGVLHLDRQVIRVSESRNVGSVTVRARTPWASVSRRITSLLIERVNEYNVTTRQSQAAAEARYAESMAAAAEVELRAAEDALLGFLQQNRQPAGSPALQAERDRLAREVALRQELYGSLVMSRDEARLRRVRDTPVLSVTEPPTLPAIGESRGTVLRAFLGALAGMLVVVGSLLLRRALGEPPARATPSDLRRALEDALPSRVAALFGPRAAGS